MANLVVSSVCNLECAHCFARPSLQPRASRNRQAFVSLEAFERYLDYLDRSRISEARLLGGEPSLHPAFSELIRRARQRNKHIVVFTHGLLSEQALASLESLTPEEGTILVNMNAGAASETLVQDFQEHRRKTLLRLGPGVIPGFTIVKPEFHAGFILPLILETGCQKVVRLGLAQPALAGRNAYLHPKQYVLTGRNIVRLAEAAGKAGIILDFDCGFVPCMFSEVDMQLLRQSEVRVAWRCSPVIDLGLDGIVQHCFPLSERIWLPLDSSDNAASLQNALQEQTRAFRVAGIYKECSSCILKLDNECPGGCLAATFGRFSRTAFRLRLPAELTPAQDSTPNYQTIH